MKPFASRVILRLRAAGVLSALWTVAASVGSKVQTLALLAVAGRTDGAEGVGQVVLSVSLGAFCLTVLDAGLSTQIVRVFAGATDPHRRYLVRPILLRIPMYFPLAGVLGFALAGADQNRLLFAVATITWAVGLQCSQAVSQAIYGRGNFRGGATVNGVLRATSVPILVLLGLSGYPPLSLVVALGIAELVIAFVQYRRLSGGQELAASVEEFRFGSTWRYGVGGIANTLMNRSDTVVVSIFGTLTTVGLYGVASQVENALTTLALVPAAALVTYTTRSVTSGRASMHLPVVVVSVAVIYAIGAVPFLIWPNQLVGLVFGGSVVSVDAIRLCVVAGIFSCLAGVGMQQLVGLGRATTVAILWPTIAVVAISALAIGTHIGADVGSAWGALIRDTFFFSLVWLCIARAKRTSIKACPGAGGVA